MASVLKSSPNLECLTMHTCVTTFSKHESFCRICRLPSPFSWDDGQNTEHHHCLCDERELSLGIDKFLDHWKNEIKLVKLLLNNCKKLEKMIITTAEMHDSPLKSKLLHCLAKKLEIFPRASEKAEISVLEFNQKRKCVYLRTSKVGLHAPKQAR